MENKFQIIAKTFNGLEQVLAQELTELGAENVDIKRRAVFFDGDKALLYKANLRCRTAVRFIVPIFTFEAHDADEIYDQVKSVDWEQYITPSKTFAIDTTVYSDVFTHSKFVAYRTKDAIADQFMDKYGKRPSVSLTNPDLMLNVHIDQTMCSLCLDSSGESLHKRGYRVAQTEAPINEVLAAGMLKMAGWDGQCDFIDPMCGSGTILIEAALMALNIPPGVFRKSFAFEKWNDFDKDLFDELYNDDSCEREFTHKIYGSDISRVVIDTTEQNVKSAGVGKYVELKPCDINNLELPETEKILMVSNPPYGERLRYEDMENLYNEIGRMLKFKFTGNTAWLISSNEDLLDCVGMKPSQKIALSNAELDCLFCEYEIFAGKRNDHLCERYGERKVEDNTSSEKVRGAVEIDDDDAAEFGSYMSKKERFSSRGEERRPSTGRHFRDSDEHRDRDRRDDRGGDRSGRFEHRSFGDREDRGTRPFRSDRGDDRRDFHRRDDDSHHSDRGGFHRSDRDGDFHSRRPSRPFGDRDRRRDDGDFHSRGRFDRDDSHSARPFRTGRDSFHRDRDERPRDNRFEHRDRDSQEGGSSFRRHDSSRQRNSDYPFRHRRDEGNEGNDNNQD